MDPSAGNLRSHLLFIMGIKITVALLALMVKGAVERDIFLGLVGSLLQKCEDNVLMRPIRLSLGLA